MPNKISDYTILNILQVAGIETMRTGNSIVCRCPICKSGEPLKKDNFEAQINDNNEIPTLFCHSCGKAYNRTELISELNLYSVLNIPEYNDNYRPQPQRPVIVEKKEKPAPAPVVAPAPVIIADKAEIERLLTVEIPPVLWNRTAESFKNIGLTKWNGQNRLLVAAPNGSTITRNAGHVKWKWQGSQPVFNRISGKSLVFIASGIAEWLILDWLQFDYIVLPSDSIRARLVNFKAELKNKAVIILPDRDKSDSFDKVIKAVKAIAERVHVCNFYDDHDFRDYCRRTAPAFDMKEQFIDSLLYNILIELGGNESVEQVSEKDIFSLIPYSPLPQQDTQDTLDNIEPKVDKVDYSQYLISNLIKNIKPIQDLRILGLKIQYQAIMGILGSTSAGKTDIALQLVEEHANIDGHISLYLYYEGLPNEIGIRAEKKKMSGQNVYAINNIVDFRFIDEFINNFKDKKILIVTDYYQALAWNIYLASDDRKTTALREYMTQIFVEQNKLRIKHENICLFNIYSINNDAIRESGKQRTVNPFSVLSGAKEDGNVAYQLDYAYSALFSDDMVNWKLSRYDEDGNLRKYIKLASAKPARVGIESGNPVYEWEDGKFKLIDNSYNNNDNYNNNNNEVIYENEYEKAGF